MDSLFEEIITNPAEWDPSGLLKLRRRIDPDGPQHQCKVGCSPNMCKGTVCFVFCTEFQSDIYPGDELEAFLERHKPAFDRVIYVGDGSNDFCPVLRLRRCVLSMSPPSHPFINSILSSQDIVLCRRHRGLEKLIPPFEQEGRLNCQVRYWAGAWEVEEIFKQF